MRTSKELTTFFSNLKFLSAVPIVRAKKVPQNRLALSLLQSLNNSVFQLYLVPQTTAQNISIWHRTLHFVLWHAYNNLPNWTSEAVPVPAFCAAVGRWKESKEEDSFCASRSETFLSRTHQLSICGRLAMVLGFSGPTF